jgi:hypothetical protein
MVSPTTAQTFLNNLWTPISPLELATALGAIVSPGLTEVVDLEESGQSCLRIRALISLVLSACFALAMFTLVASDDASAGDGLKIVRGYVWDKVGRTVEGADVTVNIRWASDDTIRSTLTEATNSDGFYSVSFGMSDWDIGDRIQTIATYNSIQDDNSTIATNSNIWPIQFLNVTFAFEIPQFGSTLGLVIAGGAVGAVAVVSLVVLRRQPSPKA